ncbi:AIG2 family protein [Chloroherpeton thalassium ATCC 35110]|uniref:AIG2 family protein n=1 Tax=Chloroherpeton thalassium (strain ATCC 35110 / GB-78) TaxID=517418 RepID=B3QZC6_CHLT3|nr:gamma-glutamylcyclotransferase family protein [Chloroherpeton thalassium]ACF13819.1 AIG2 family protein [Chloroherpeton thalassium ATCC 35110]
MDEHTVEYFAYGSNMNPIRLHSYRQVYFFSQRPAILRGYELVFNKVSPGNRDQEAGVANIVPRANSFVEGILYEVDEDGLEKLDLFEGVTIGHYYRTDVQVELKNGKTMSAQTYIACNDQIKEGLKPSKEYLGHLLAAKRMLSPNYANRLLAVETAD